MLNISKQLKYCQSLFQIKFLSSHGITYNIYILDVPLFLLGHLEGVLLPGVTDLEGEAVPLHRIRGLQGSGRSLLHPPLHGHGVVGQVHEEGLLLDGLELQVGQGLGQGGLGVSQGEVSQAVEAGGPELDGGSPHWPDPLALGRPDLLPHLPDLLHQVDGEGPVRGVGGAEEGEEDGLVVRHEAVVLDGLLGEPLLLLVAVSLTREISLTRWCRGSCTLFLCLMCRKTGPYTKTTKWTIL